MNSPTLRVRWRPAFPLLVVAVVVAALVGLTALLAPRARAAVPAGFVYRCGIHFCLDGKTLYVAGANTYDVMTYGGSYGDTETQWMDKTRIDNHFAELQANKVGVLRLWMFDHETWHGFEPSKGTYSEQQFSEFDYIIQSAKAHNVRLIPTLENYWEAYGGIDTRLTWEGLGTGQANRWRFFNKTACPGCFTQYKNYVNYALNRTNHYSGVKYKDDPTIFAWDLMNEPRYEQVSTAESTGGMTLRAWVDEMGAYIKGIDPNHMVVAGIEGHQTKYGFGGDEGNPFVYIQQSPYVDFTSAHPYPNEGWAALDLPKTLTLINAWISDSLNQVGKPFFMGEWNTMGVDRSTWWTSIFQTLEAGDAAGSAFWWYPDPQAGGDNYAVKTGAAELSVFRAHADRMAAKSGYTPTTGPTTGPTTARTTGPTTARTTGPTTARTTAPTTPTTTRPTTPPTTTPSRTSASPSVTTALPLGCRVAYSTNDWGSGFVANVTITNSSTAINGWTLTWSFSGNQQISNAWSATVTQTGTQVTAKNAAWNAALPTNGSVTFGFQATYSGSNAVPAQFALNGIACNT